MPRKGPSPKANGGVPAGFSVRRDLTLGRHPILEAFPGLDRLPTAERHEPDGTKREQLHHHTFVELVADDVWMYVAPHEVPPGARAQWRPVLAQGADCIVIGESHLRESPELILFLDIFHELCHIRQRHAGLELWDRRFSYVTRPTEVEAYQFVVDEARRFGVKDAVLRDYLRVEWIDEKEFLQLLATMGISAS
ncbi:MAG: hypothetical protein L3J91_01180 [Thermoplasmata archaeon]|nr:hypothetical protein [Thermoplasmata archaeon]